MDAGPLRYDVLAAVGFGVAAVDVEADVDVAVDIHVSMLKVVRYFRV